MPVPLLPQTRGGLLASATLENLHKFFLASTNHRPSDSMWAALEDLVVTMESMATGKAPASFFLSSLDPGVGKTAAVVSFVDTLLAYPAYENVGVLICVSRLDEIRGLVQRAGIPKEWLACLTSDDEVNALGGANPNDARVLFTTHQMALRRTEGRSFGEAREFFFEDKPRFVRVWDESVLPGQALTVSRDDLAFLFRPLRATHPAFIDTLEQLFGELGKLEDGSRYVLPDFVSDHDLNLNDTLGLLQGGPEDQRAALSTLFYLSGKVVTVRRDGAYGQTALDYRDTLPADLAPMVILDASGRVRRTYSNWAESRGGLVRLMAAPKKYDALTIHAWQTGGGKGSFERKGEQLAAGIAATIATKLDEDWLVVSHRPKGKLDTEAQVRALLPATAKVSWLTWGKHDSTNAYSHIPNVILAGTLFYRASFYEALGRASAGLRSADGPFDPEETARVVEGENRHLILQALCRGAVRSSDGDTCRPCHAFIIASTSSGIPAALPEVFPGCRMESWRPIKRTLKGRVADAVAFVESWLEENPTESFLSFKAISKALGIKSAGNFANDVRRHSDFQDAVSELGLIEFGKGRYHTGFLRTAPGDLFADA